MTLGDYLTAAARHRWQTGRHDCTTFAADWACTWGHGDPMAAWRGLYATDEEARCLIRRAGGLLALYGEGMGGIGATEITDPREGDIGVILAVNLDHEAEEIGAIWTGRRWAFRTHGGLGFSSALCYGAWSRP